MVINAKHGVDFAALMPLWIKYQVQQAWLFGSVLREDFATHSDVDILIEYDSSAQVTLLDMAELQQAVSIVVGYPVDLATPRSLSKYIRQRVMDEAQVIYERKG